MSLRVDLAARRMVVSVRTLVEGASDPLRGRGEMAALRAALGVEIHQRRQAERSAEPGFAAEVDVSRVFEVDGWEATVRGRVDGVRRVAGRVEIEEIKSVQRTGEQLRAMDARDFADACLQAQIYAVCLRPDAPVDAHLWLVSVLDGATRAIEVPIEDDAVEARVVALLQATIARAVCSEARTAALRDAADRLRFPFGTPRPHQTDLIGAVASALEQGRPAVVSAPTGSGKTVSAMLPSLAFAMREGARLFWATAKTTQQALAATTLTRIAEGQPLIRGATLRARAKMCPPGDLRCHPRACRFLADYDARAHAAGIVDTLVAESTVVDPDRVYAEGVAHGLCPYELGLDIAAQADVVIGDYNYVYDAAAALRPFKESTGRPAVVVVDEAHNLPDRARGYASPFLSRGAARHARGVARADAVDDTLPHDADALLSELEAWIDDRLRDAATAEIQGVDSCAPHPLADATFGRLASHAQRVLLRHCLSRLRDAETGPEDPLLACLRTVVRLDAGLRTPTDAIVPYVAGPGAPDGVGVGLMCVDAADLLHPVHERTLGTVAMSATLAPIDEHARSLGLERLHPRRIEIPSGFPREHRCVAIVPSISTAYREREAHLDAIADAILTTIRARPGRYAAFFPSFAFLAKVQPRLGLPRGRVVVQIPGMSHALRRRALDTLRQGDDERLLLAVSGGVFAEGVDLPGGALTGAIVVGPALPAVTFERELMREYHDARAESGFARAYLFGGMQRAVQAAGRVIRTMDDHGVIVLLGRRFADPNYAACFPEDWYAHSPAELVTENLDTTLSEFWAGF